MLPKIATALARVLEPIRPIARPGQSISFTKSAESGGGGHGTLGYEAPKKKDTEPASEKSPPPSTEPHFLEGKESDTPEKRHVPLPFQPGLTQVIIDLSASRAERNAGTAAQSYETGAKEQKKNARLPKGSMLDKKVG